MRAGPSGTGSSRWLSWAATASVGLLGCALLAAGAGVGGRSEVLAGAGALVAAAVLVGLVAGGWLDALPLLALSLPLPALLATGDARLAPAAGVAAVVVGGWALARAPDLRPLRTGGLPGGFILALAVAAALSAVFARDTLAAARELVNWILFLGLLVAASAEIADSPPRRAHRLALVLAAVTGIAGALAVVQAFGGLPGRFPLSGTGMTRATLGFGWPNELGIFLAVGVPLAVYPLRRGVVGGSARVLAAVGLAAALAGLVATFSRGSWLALAAATPVLLLFGRHRMALWALAAAAVLVVAMEVATGGAVIRRAVSTVDDPYVVQRLALTLTGLLMFRDNLLVGVGPGGFAGSLEDYGPRVEWLWDYVGSAHNAYVDVAAEMGLVGLVPFVALVGVSLVRLVRRARAVSPEADPAGAALRQCVAWAFAVACLAGFVGWPLAHGLGQMLCLVLAIGFGLGTAGARGGAG